MSYILSVLLCFLRVVAPAAISYSTLNTTLLTFNATRSCIGPHLQRSGPHLARKTTNSPLETNIRSSPEDEARIPVPTTNLRFQLVYITTFPQSPPLEAYETMSALLEAVRADPQQWHYVSSTQQVHRYWYMRTTHQFLRSTTAALIPIPVPVGPDPDVHPLLFQEAAVFLHHLIVWLSRQPLSRDFTFLLERVTGDNIVTNVATGGLCTSEVESSDVNAAKPNLS